MKPTNNIFLIPIIQSIIINQFKYNLYLYGYPDFDLDLTPYPVIRYFYINQ